MGNDDGWLSPIQANTVQAKKEKLRESSMSIDSQYSVSSSRFHTNFFGYPSFFASIHLLFLTLKQNAGL